MNRYIKAGMRGFIATFTILFGISGISYLMVIARTYLKATYGQVGEVAGYILLFSIVGIGIGILNEYKKEPRHPDEVLNEH